MTYVRRKKSIFVRSIWVMLAVFFALLTVLFSVGSSIAADNAAPINKTLGAQSSIKVQVGGSSGEIVDHYPSAFIERYAWKWQPFFGMLSARMPGISFCSLCSRMISLVNWLSSRCSQANPGTRSW